MLVEKNSDYSLYRKSGMTKVSCWIVCWLYKDEEKYFRICNEYE